MDGSGVRRIREIAGLTQGQLAQRAGVSRQMVGAIESGRHLPRVDAAIALATALGVEVAELFGSDAPAVDVVSGAPQVEGAALRLGWVGDRLVTAPVRTGSDGWDAADALVKDGRLVHLRETRPGAVVAGCEPGLETLEHLLRQGGLGGLAVATSSLKARKALEDGRAHAAVIHGTMNDIPRAPAGVARFQLAGWRVGLVVPQGIGSSWWSRVRAGTLDVVQREIGASVQATFEAALGGSPVVSGPRVSGHVSAARHGVAAGLPAVTIEPAARAAGAEFYPLAYHEVELWVGEQWLADRGVQTLLTLVGSSHFQRQLGAVGGYELDAAGRRVS